MSKRQLTKQVFARGPLFAAVLVAATLLPAACKRREAAAPATATSAVTLDPKDDFPAGCLETNPPAGKATACMDCLRKNAINKPINDGCCGVTDPVGVKLCEAVASCMRAGGPPVGSCNVGGDTTTCYCGNHQAGCSEPGRANGPCAAQITAAAGRDVETQTTDQPTPTVVLARYGLVKYALGRAANIAAIAGAFCKAECGISM